MTERRCPVCNMKLFEGSGTLEIKCRRCHSVIRLDGENLSVVSPVFRATVPRPKELKAHDKE